MLNDNSKFECSGWGNGDPILKPSKKIVQSSGAKKLKKIQRWKRRQKARAISDS